MATPRPKLDLFNESPFLVAKKCRTSTPSLRPPKPPTKSSTSIRRRPGYLDRSFHHYNSSNDNPHNHSHHQHHVFNRLNESFPSKSFINNSIEEQDYGHHEGSFLFGLAQQTIEDEQDTNGIHCSRLSQQFEIIAKIGSGNFGEVYKVKSLLDNKLYAIKKTSIPFTSDSDRKRKLQEVKNHESLPPHDNCVRYYDSWEEDRFLYIQTELCKTSLNEILETRDDHKLPEQSVWNYLVDLISAVKHLHDHDLIHLDIKPDNIFISFDGKAKLGDFGLMCNCLDLNSSTVANMSATGLNEYDDIFHDHRSSDHSRFNNQNNNNNEETRSINNHTQERHLVSSILDADDSGCLNKTFDSTMANLHESSSVDSIDEGDSKYLASETMQGKFTKAADIFSLGITIFEVASGLDLPQRGEVYHKLRHNMIDDQYFNGLTPDLVKIIKMMMEANYLKRPSVDDLLKMDIVKEKQSSRVSRNHCW